MAQAAQAGTAMIQHLYMAIGALGKAFYKKYGKEAIPIITEVASRGGEESGKRMQEMAPVKDMKAVGEQFKMMASMMGIDMDILELSDKAIHFKVSHCALGIEGTSKELCEAIMTSDKKRIGSFLGQDVDMKILKSVAAGDKECEIIFSKK